MGKTIAKRNYNKKINTQQTYSYSDVKKFNRLSFESKCYYIWDFYDDLKKLKRFKKIKPTNLAWKKVKRKVYFTVNELCKNRFEKDKLNQKFRNANSKIKDYDDGWF